MTPDGTDSFTTVTTTESTALPQSADDAGNDGVVPTNLTNEVTLEQTWNGSDDWIVQQSVTNSFTDSSPDSADADAPVVGRTGTESYSLAVVNGTTTVSTYTKTDNRTQQVGSIPGQSDDPDSDPFAIPEDWITRSRSSVFDNSTSTNSTSTNSTSTNDEDNDEDNDDSAAVEDGAGITEETDTGLTITVTTTEITLPDGTPATEMSTSASWSASFEWKSSGSSSGDETDLDDDDSDLPSNLTASVESEYEVYASASIGASFSVTVVTPTAGDDLTPQVSMSFGFAISVMAGGSMSSTATMGLDDSSGSTDDDTDTYSKIIVNDSSEAAGSMGFSFWVAYSSDDSSQDSTDDTDQTPVVSGGAGQTPAMELLEENSSGAQLDFEVKSSSSSTQDHTIEEKTRYSTTNEFGFEQFSINDVQETESEQHVTIAMGTEEMLIDIGSKGSDSVTKIEEYEMKTTAAPGTYYEGLVEGTSSAYSENIQTSYEFGFTLGGEDGFGLTNDNSYDVAISAVNTTFSDDSGYITEEIYRDYSDDVGDEITTKGDDLPEKIHRKTETSFSPSGNTVNIVFEKAPAGDAPSQGNDRTREEILAEYRDRQIQVERLRELLERTTDPEMRAMLLDQIAMQEEIIAEVAQEAANAGVSESELAAIDAEAANAAGDDPINLQSPAEVNFDDVSFAGLAMINIGAIWDGFDEGVQEFIVGGTAGAGTGAGVGAGVGVWFSGIGAAPGALIGSAAGFIGGGLSTWWFDPDETETNLGSAIVSGGVGGAVTSFFVVGLWPAPSAGGAGSGVVEHQASQTSRYLRFLDQVRRGIQSGKK